MQTAEVKRQGKRELPQVREAELRVRAARSSRPRAEVLVDPDRPGARHCWPAAGRRRGGEGAPGGRPACGIRGDQRADRGGEREDLRGQAGMGSEPGMAVEGRPNKHAVAAEGRASETGVAAEGRMVEPGEAAEGRMVEPATSDQSLSTLPTRGAIRYPSWRNTRWLGSPASHLGIIETGLPRGKLTPPLIIATSASPSATEPAPAERTWHRSDYARFSAAIRRSRHLMVDRTARRPPGTRPRWMSWPRPSPPSSRPTLPGTATVSSRAMTLGPGTMAI